jgi:hypothetical protein
VAEDQTHEETDEKVALEVTPEDTTADLQPEDLASEDLASEDLASQEIASENVLPEDETKLAPEDVTPEDETPENVAPESPEAIDNTNPVSVESPVEPAEAPVKNPAPSAETLDS